LNPARTQVYSLVAAAEATEGVVEWEEEEEEEEEEVGFVQASQPSRHVLITKEDVRIKQLARNAG
jgi:hypothetical protein